MMKNVFVTLAIFALAFAGLPAIAANYDLVIKNGRVMDPETGFDKVANVGITDGTIVKISTGELTGKKTVDATGHAFILAICGPKMVSRWV